MEMNGNLSNDKMRVKAAMLAAERRVRYLTTFVLSNDFSGSRDGVTWLKFEEFLSGYPRFPYEMLERALLNAAASISWPGDRIAVKSAQDAYLFFSPDSGALLYVLRQMNALGWITLVNSIPGDFYIEAKGWQKVEELTKKTNESQPQAFVAMWFDKTMQDIYEKGICPAVEKDKKTRCVRIDLEEFNDDICDQIIASIRKSRYVIADITGNRGAVYFEAGFAYGFGIPVIWLVKKDDLHNVAFDTNHYKHIVYETPEELYEKLSNRIDATIVAE